MAEALSEVGHLGDHLAIHQDHHQAEGVLEVTHQAVILRILIDQALVEEQEILTIKTITTEAVELEEQEEVVVDIYRLEVLLGLVWVVVLLQELLAPELVTRKSRVLGNKILKIKPKSDLALTSRPQTFPDDLKLTSMKECFVNFTESSRWRTDSKLPY